MILSDFPISQTCLHALSLDAHRPRTDVILSYEMLWVVIYLKLQIVGNYELEILETFINFVLIDSQNISDTDMKQ